ncbi:MAG TPA: VanZ family protein [Nitrospira sp.]|nr:VanZ family protein [Nitrospira sp.]
MTIVLILGCMSALWWGAMIVPGVGVSGHVLITMSPIFVDWAHAPGYGVLAWLLIRGLQRRLWPHLHAVIVGSVAAFVFGLWTEILQGSVPGRYPSLEDLIVNAAGIATVAAMALLRMLPERLPSDPRSGDALPGVLGAGSR